jgi:hypothetical protein
VKRFCSMDAEPEDSDEIFILVMLAMPETRVRITLALYFASIRLATIATWVTLVKTEFKLLKFTYWIVSPIKVAFKV